MEDPYETGDGSEAWCTKECLGKEELPECVPGYYQVVSPVSRESSRSGTPVEPDSPKQPGRRGVYVLPSPPLKRWLWEQTRVKPEEDENILTVEQFKDAFTIRRSDWIFLFAEVPMVSPSMAKIGHALTQSHSITLDSQVIMIYAADMRSPVVKVDGCLATAENGGKLGVRSSLVRYIISTASYKGMKVSTRPDDMEAYCVSRVETSDECNAELAKVEGRKTVSVWVTFVVEPGHVDGTATLRVLAHALSDSSERSTTSVGRLESPTMSEGPSGSQEKAQSL
jgi:hypothetical protein